MQPTSLIFINWWEFAKGIFEWAFAFTWLIVKMLLLAWPLWILLLAIFLAKTIIGRQRFYNAHIPSINNHQPTSEVQRLGKLLSGYGWKVELEKYDGYKHIDIAVTEARVNIEVDGRQHHTSTRQAFADLERTYYSFKKGFITLRIPNILVRNPAVIDETAKFINKFLQESKSQLVS
jgi:very-short-patch-repair endonuclease